MVETVGKIGIILCLLFIVSGCWSRRELDDIAIVMAMALDKQGDQYRVAAQLVNPSEVAAKKGGVRGAPVVTYAETSDTLFGAVREITRKSPRKFYFSHMRMLVIGEPLAREGIGKTLDFLSRDHEFRSDFYLAVAKGVPAAKVLDTYTVPMELIPATKLFKMLESTTDNIGGSWKVTLDEVLSDIVSDGKEPVLAAVEVVGKARDEASGTQANVDRINPITSLAYDGLAVFKKDRMLGWLSPEDSIAYNLITGNIKSTIIPVTCPEGGTIVLEIIRSESGIKGRVRNGMPEADLRLRLEANVGEAACKLDLSDPAAITELEKEANRTIEARLDAVVGHVQQRYRSDIFGFGEAIHRADPKLWKQWRKDWSRKFANLSVNYTVKVNIRRIGTVTQSIENKLGE